MSPKMNSISQALKEISQQLGLTWVLDCDGSGTSVLFSEKLLLLL